MIRLAYGDCWQHEMQPNACTPTLILTMRLTLQDFRVQVRQVKLALHVGAGVAAGQLPPCREAQIDALQAALRQHLDGTSGGRAVYVAGLPGTGAVHYAPLFMCMRLSYRFLYSILGAALGV